MYLFDCNGNDVLLWCCSTTRMLRHRHTWIDGTVRRLFVITASNTSYSILMVTVAYNIRLDFCHLNITVTSQFKHRFALNCFCQQLPAERFMVNRLLQTRTTIPFGFYFRRICVKNKLHWNLATVCNSLCLDNVLCSENLRINAVTFRNSFTGLSCSRHSEVSIFLTLLQSNDGMTN